MMTFAAMLALVISTSVQAQTMCNSEVVCNHYRGAVKIGIDGQVPSGNTSYEVDLSQGSQGNSITWKSRFSDSMFYTTLEYEFDRNGNFSIFSNGNLVGNGLCQNLSCHYSYCLTQGSTCGWSVDGSIQFLNSYLKIDQTSKIGLHTQVIQGQLNSF